MILAQAQRLWLRPLALMACHFPLTRRLRFVEACSCVLLHARLCLLLRIVLHLVTDVCTLHLTAVAHPRATIRPQIQGRVAHSAKPTAAQPTQHRAMPPDAWSCSLLSGAGAQLLMPCAEMQLNQHWPLHRLAIGMPCSLHAAFAFVCAAAGCCLDVLPSFRPRCTFASYVSCVCLPLVAGMSLVCFR